MMRLTVIGLALALLFGGAGPAAAKKKREKAKAGFKAIQKALKKPEKNAELLAKIFPDRLVKDRSEWTEEKTKAWREGYGARFAAAKLVSVTESGDRAFVRFGGKTKDTELLVRMKHDGERWIVDCPEVYLVKGRLLDTANGEGPARVTITARQKNSEYGGSAYSFAHVTKDKALCKNRMDLWFCKHGDLHTCADDRIAVIGARKKLAKVEDIDAAWEFKDDIIPAAGTTYAVHCLRDDHRDFYVKLTVVKVSEKALTFEWALLAAGTGSPGSIAKAQPIETNDGEDGFAGMCGGKIR
jgi:hypothetical protein